jgi:DNA-binding SARP family transcriptional activator
MKERSKLRQVASGLGALAGLLVLVVGVPVALWKLVGWPLPTSLPSWDEISDALGRSDLPDSTLIKTVAVVGWLAWLQVAMSIVVEVAAWLRGRPAHRLPSAGMVQPAVRRLVATAAMLVSTATSNLSIAAASPALPPAVVVVEHTSVVVASPAFRTENGVTAAPAPSSPTYVVQRRDTLWGLAEAHLGDPFRWRELYELNEGVRQADGGALSDPYLMQIGWVLTFPADATGLAPAETSPAPAAPTIEAAPASPPTCEPAEPGEATATTSTTLGLPTPTTSGAATTPPATTVPVPSDQPQTTDQPTDETPNRAPRVPLPVVGGGLLAASLLVVLTRLRQVQQRRRRPGQRARRPRPDLAPIETAIRVGADTDDAHLLDLGLRAFLDGLHRQKAPAPVEVLAVRLLDHRLEVLLDRPIDQNPEGFEDLGERRAWRSTRALTGGRLARLAAESPAPLPALVALGIADGGELLIDLETAGLLTITGAGECTESFVRRLATELATSTWADHLDVLIADPKLGDLTGTQRMRHVESVDEALDELAAAGRLISAALEAAGCENTLAGRVAGLGTADWTPTVLIHAGTLTPEQRDRLGNIVGSGGRGVAAVIASSRAGSAWSISIGDGVAHAEPLGISFAPHVLNVDVASAIDELLTDTAIDDPVDELHQLPDAPVAPVAASAEDAGIPPRAVRYVDIPFDVEVRVLGDVQITGATFDRRRVVELIAYLTLHPGGVTDERLKTALWPDQAPSAATFNTTVSQARNGLGRKGEDLLRFPHFAATGNLYRLDASVTCDALRFEARVKHARRCEPSDAIETLRSALELVRGMPFTAATGYEWAHTEGLIACYEAMIGDAAHRLATLYLDAQDHDGATWAAMQGLKASPGNEVLYRDRMLASHLTGNLAAVKAVLNELCEVVEANEPYDSLHPETLALYERLVGTKRLA